MMDIRLLLVLTCFFIQCANGNEVADKLTGEAEAVSIMIDLSKTYQTIDNFGASDAWAGQFVGNWPEAKKSEIADLLFSTEFDSKGQPKGIGLSLWRFNIGAGSVNNEGVSSIDDEWRAAESFLKDDGSYDWNRQKGQLWFLNAAKARGVDQFLAFTNSPPVKLTVNGKAFATQGIANIAADKYDSFAVYLTDVLKAVENKTGVLFNYISPVNEPQWDWSDGGQEGISLRNSEVSGIVKALNNELEKENLATKIIIGEAGQYEFLYAEHNKPGKGEQITAFFNSRSPDYIGNLSKVESAISAHSYFTTSPLNKAIAIREKVAQEVSKVKGLKFWQTEYCILGDNVGEIDGNNRDLGIQPALYVARTVHTDLVMANASAWQWWLAISPYNYKDGLIYIDKEKTDGNFYQSKILWSLGNYSRFIRPGAVRVDVSSNDINHEKVLVSAFKDLQNHKLITVIVNNSSDSLSLKLKLVKGEMKDIKSYITSSETNLTPSPPVKNNEPVVIIPKSITTLISTIL